MKVAGIVVAEGIKNLPRNDFRRMFVRGLCQTAEFGHLAAAGAADLNRGEKAMIAEAIRQFIPSGVELDNDDLDIISWSITARAVSLR